MPILDHFGILAPYYDRVFGNNDHQTLKTLLRLPEGGILLDAGGGTGRVSRVLKDGARLAVVADESVRMLKEASLKPGLATSRSFSENLPFPDSYFNGVIMVDALHHVADQAQTVKEMWRVLKPGGRLVVEEPDIQFFLVKLIALVEKATLMRSHFLDLDSIARLVPGDSKAVKIHREGIIGWVAAEKAS